MWGNGAPVHVLSHYEPHQGTFCLKLVEVLQGGWAGCGAEHEKCLITSGPGSQSTSFSQNND